MGCVVHLAEGCFCAQEEGKRGGGGSGLMPYLILFGNSWNQCSVDTAVIHLQRWVVPKDHSQFFHHVDVPPPTSSLFPPQATATLQRNEYLQPPPP